MSSATLRRSVKRNTLLRSVANSDLHLLNVMNDAVGEVGAAGAGLGAVALELAGDVVGDVELAAGLLGGLLGLGKGGFGALIDQLGGLVPGHVLQHHGAGEEHGAGVGLVLAGVFGG